MKPISPLPPRMFLLALGLLASSAVLWAQPEAPYEPSPENLRAREWFRDARFGLFVHWGVYAQLAGTGVVGQGNTSEWVMETRKIPISRYEKLADFFYPVNYDPAQWVALAQAAGMRYITFTTKHHDGFAMYDSEVSSYNVVDATPYQQDVFGLLAKAAGNDANLLLNVGPQPDGRIQEEFVAILRTVGEWLEIHGEAIYGTRGGPIAPRSWGVTTQTEDRVYVHVLDWYDEELSLPDFGKNVQRAYLLKSGIPIAVDQTDHSLRLQVPREGRDALNTVLVLEVTTDE